MMNTTHTLSILALEKDLFFSEKIRDTLKHHNMHVTIARTLTAFEQHLNSGEQPALVIINTAIRGVDWEAAIRMAHSLQLPVLCFGSHMDLEARQKALQAGAQKVVANSKFSQDMAGLITRMVTNRSLPEDDAASEPV